MHTIRLQVDNKIYSSLIQFLSKFEKGSFRVIEETEDFVSTKQYLENELSKIESENAIFISVEQLENAIDETITAYES
jgi:hypothetical protein